MKRKILTEEQDKIWEKWSDEYMPNTGPAETVAGEIIRAFNRIGYRWYNDGDRVGVGYGIETCSSSNEWLRKTVPGYSSPTGSGQAYERSMLMRQYHIFEYLQGHPELFSKPNKEDSR